MEWTTEAIEAARRRSIDPRTVLALIAVESGGNRWAWNPEPRYRYMWNVKKHVPFRTLTDDEIRSIIPPPDFPTLFGDPDQEWWAQRASWGLMQVMGAVAREMLFADPYLTALCDPIINIAFGCNKLQSLLKWADSDEERALAAYNGGTGGNSHRPLRNQDYANLILRAKEKITI